MTVAAWAQGTAALLALNDCCWRDLVYIVELGLLVPGTSLQLQCSCKTHF